MLNILQSPISFPAINPFLISKTNIKHSPQKERLLSPIYGPTLLLLLAACHHNSSRTNRDEMENMLANAPQTILIEGSEGDDTDLSGTSGDDKYIASGGNDSVDGGAGTDKVDYSEWDGHIQVTAQAGGGLQIEKYNAEGVLVGTDTLTNIEHVINQKDEMQFVQTADDAGQTLRGHSAVIGGQTKRDFDDVLVGGAGDDIFVASAASGTVLAGADIVTDFTAGDKIQLQLTQTQRDAIDAITGDAAKLAELKKVIEIAAQDADGQSDTNDTVLTNKGMDGAVGGDDDTVLMVLEDYDTALTFDDFALEVI